MPEDRWVEMEYQALQEQMSKLLDVGQSAVRFCLPAAAAVYALPVLVQQTSQTYLWALCTGLASLLITAMVHTFCACVTGGRRIGAYIKEAIEPHTKGGMRWEAMIFEWENRETRRSMSPLLAISAGALLANVAAAAGAGAVFLHGAEALIPPMIAVLFVPLSLPAAFNTARSSNARRQCVADVSEFLGALHSASARENLPTVDAAKQSPNSEATLPVRDETDVVRANIR